MHASGLGDKKPLHFYRNIILTYQIEKIADSLGFGVRSGICTKFDDRRLCEDSDVIIKQFLSQFHLGPFF